MKIQPAVRKETRRIALGTGILSLMMILVFVLVRQFDYTVLLGAAWGTIAAVANFFLMALSVQRMAESMRNVSLPTYEEKDMQEAESEQQAKSDDPKRDISAEVSEIKQAKRRMQACYTGRMLMVAVAGILGIVFPFFHSLASLLPLMFPQFIVMANKLFFRKEA